MLLPRLPRNRGTIEEMGNSCGAFTQRLARKFDAIISVSVSIAPGKTR